MYSALTLVFGALTSQNDPVPNLSMREFVSQSKTELDYKLSSYYDYYYKSCYDYQYDQKSFTISATECSYSASTAHGVLLQAAASSS